MGSSSQKKVDSELLKLPQFQLLRDGHEILPGSTNEKLLEALSQYTTDDSHTVDIVIENQRGMKIFGIPLFSNNSLVPILDPSNYQMLNGTNALISYNDLMNYPLPDLDWEWTWPRWYTLMFEDVDDQGWIYSNISFNSRHWKGKYFFGNFIRRRIWIRMRNETTS